MSFRYNYKCVIAGWDEKCEASDEWVLQMGVHLLEKKDDQPFYNVLVDDGSTRYAAQGLLFRTQFSFNPESTKIFLYKPWRPKGFFQFEII